MTDPLARRAARLLASGLLDVEFYAALRGVDFDDGRAAALDWVSVGMPGALSPHPFLDFASLPPDVRRAWRKQRVRLLIEHLTGDDGVVRPAGPLADAADPEAAREAMLAVAREMATPAAEPVETSGPDWSQVRAALPDRVPGRTSVVIPTHADSWFTIRAVQAVLETTRDHDVEVICVDDGSPAHVALALAAHFYDTDRAQVLRLQRTQRKHRARDLGFASTTGDMVVLLANDTRVRTGWLEPLRQVLGDPAVAGVQPLLLGPDDMIASAGFVLSDDQHGEHDTLAGHPREDAAALVDVPLAGITDTAVALRASDVVALGGTQAATAPLSRIPEGDAVGGETAAPPDAERNAKFRVVPESAVTHHSAPVLPPLASRVTGSRSQPFPSKRQGESQFRWSLNLPSSPGFWGDTWGDTYFAERLAVALRGLSQEVVTRRNGAHRSGPIHLDQVALALRGRTPVHPSPGSTNVLWVISHPDQVGPDEVRRFDLVFAASEVWAREMSRRAGRDVVPLLQATFITPLALSPSALPKAKEAVFVGNTDNGRTRPLVRWAIQAGLRVAVYGRGWDGQLPAGSWKSEHIPNEELPDLYRHHGLVLADHWSDMAHHGFVANRVFDALAAGARVVSDQVTGLDQLFDGAVHIVRSVADLRDLRRTGVLERPLDPQVSARTVREHHLDVRARLLLGAVAAQKSTAGP